MLRASPDELLAESDVSFPYEIVPIWTRHPMLSTGILIHIEEFASSAINAVALSIRLERISHPSDSTLDAAYPISFNLNH